MTCNIKLMKSKKVPWVLLPLCGKLVELWWEEKGSSLASSCHPPHTSAAHHGSFWLFLNSGRQCLSVAHADVILVSCSIGGAHLSGPPLQLAGPLHLLITCADTKLWKLPLTYIIGSPDINTAFLFWSKISGYLCLMDLKTGKGTSLLTVPAEPHPCAFVTGTNNLISHRICFKYSQDQRNRLVSSMLYLHLLPC